MQEAKLLQEQLIGTKFFVPLVSHTLINRPRLTNLLDELNLIKLTLVSAPAGFGKTTLVANWVQSLPKDEYRIAWVSLEESDNQPRRFWSYVLTALEQYLPGLVETLVPQLQSQPELPVESILTRLINRLLEASKRFVLVLDDFHLITETALHNSLTFLLDHLPPQLHLILTTRVDPPLPLSRLRARGQLREIRTDQLRCTAEEAATFLKEVTGIQLLAEEALQEITAHTEGWLVGLQLLGLSLQGQAEPKKVLEELSGTQHYILDYLTEEVLRHQSPPIQTFLLQTSLLERLSAGLCDAVLGQTGSQQILEYLIKANLFLVALDGQRRWYRYHALFAEMLRFRMEQTQNTEVVLGLYRRASDWYRQQVQLDKALDYALLAKAWELAADLIEQMHATTTGGLGQRWILKQRVERLPEEVIAARPRLSLIYAQTKYIGMTFSQDYHWLDVAEATIRKNLTNEIEPGDGSARTHSKAYKELLGQILAFRAYLTITQRGEAHTTLVLCVEALGLVSEQDYNARADVTNAQALAYFQLGEMQAGVNCALEGAKLAELVGNIASSGMLRSTAAFFLIFQGQLKSAFQLSQQVASPGKIVSGLPPFVLSMAYCVQAAVLLEYNRLEEARKIVLSAIELCEKGKITSHIGYWILARIEQGRGESGAALTAMERGSEAFQFWKSSRAIYVLDDQVRLWLWQGNMGQVNQAIEEVGPLEAAQFTLASECLEVTMVRIRLAQHQPTEALVTLKPLMERVEKSERRGKLLEMCLLAVAAYYQLGDETQALKSLAFALKLGEAEGYIRSFVDEGEPVRLLVTKLRAQNQMKEPTPYLDSLLDAWGSNDSANRSGGTETEGTKGKPEKPALSRLSQSLIDPLTERELEILGLIAQGASNKEMASRLVLATNTIKRHVSNVLSKLGATNRTQAVAQARGLGLLSDEK